MFVELLPEAIGLIVTPLAVVGVLLLLESARPVANAVAFGTAFALVYTLLSVAVLAGGAAAGDTSASDDTHAAGIVGIVIGALFLLAGLITLLRHPARRRGTPKWVRQLETARPRVAFLAGLGAAVLNPNVIILMSGLTIVVAADVGTSTRVIGAAFLVSASLLDFLVPIGLYLVLGARAERVLGTAKQWTVAHTRVITIAMFLVLGVVFLVRGIGKL